MTHKRKKRTFPTALNICRCLILPGMSTRHTQNESNGVRGNENKYALTLRNDEVKGEPSSFISSRISW